MGVPAFFRWLTRKYPSVIIDCIEQKNPDGLPVDSSKANPNGVEFDNLYLDMNGIIHPCTHPEDKPAPQTEDEMMVAIFECIDRLFSIVRPRKVLYMAIDGVAPRAKMNQQRSRRFRASKESAEKVLTVARLKGELSEKGLFLPEEKKDKIHFDSNCITPGTPFMDRLAKCLQYYIFERLNTDAAWKGLKIFLSDANVPGEGEHKIMDFIRRQRAQPDHDANTQHVLCGADADLIMLGLATHEPHFTIIREEFKPNKPRPCELCRQMGHDMTDCIGFAEKPVVNDVEPVYGDETKYIFVRLSVLREYLKRDLAMPNLPFPYDFEKAVDDWVFMCFFVGNDFLPHLPSLEIREGAIDRLVKLYKRAVYNTGGFLTNSGLVNPSRVQMIMKELGEMEDSIFKERQRREIQFRQRNKANKASTESSKGPAWIPQGQFQPQALGGKQNVEAIKNCKAAALNMRVEGLKKGAKRPLENDSEDEEPPDEVRLYEDGFKDRYYESKFGVLPEDVKFRYRVAQEYTLGLCWVLRYYYQGCASWKWYFPYHYAPFASDFVDVDSVDIKFEKGSQPFKPMEQLMSVFPAASSSHVPEQWRDLMSNPESLIIDFYPEDFKIDLNGKKYAWQGVALLPFVDETRLKKTLEPFYPLLSEEEKRRNERGDDLLFIRQEHSGYDLLSSIYSEKSEYDQEWDMDAQVFQGVRGKALFSDVNVEEDGTIRSPVVGLESCGNNRVICVRFRDPKYPEDFIFSAARLEGAKDPPCILKPEDLNRRDNMEWKPNFGFRGGRRHDQGSLDPAGHRMLNHNLNRGVCIPPPNEDKQRGGGRGHYGGGRGRGRGYQRGGYGEHSRGYHGGGYGDEGRGQQREGGYGYYNEDIRGAKRGGYGDRDRGGSNNHWGGGNQRKQRHDPVPEDRPEVSTNWRDDTRSFNMNDRNRKNDDYFRQGNQNRGSWYSDVRRDKRRNRGDLSSSSFGSSSEWRRGGNNSYQGRGQSEQGGYSSHSRNDVFPRRDGPSSSPSSSFGSSSDWMHRGSDSRGGNNHYYQTRGQSEEGGYSSHSRNDGLPRRDGPSSSNSNHYGYYTSNYGR